MARRKVTVNTDKTLGVQPEQGATAPENIILGLRRLRNDPAWVYLKSIATRMVQLQRGAQPQTESDRERYLFASYMDKGFEMLFNQIEEVTKLPPQQVSPFDKVFAGQPIQRETTSV